MVIIRYENINDRVLELCEERGWSNHELMNKSGIDEDTLRNILEKKSVPKLDVIQKICDGFNVSLGEFFSDKTEDKEELSEDDMSIVASSRKLNASDRRRTLAYMQSLIDAN